jgi:hypothetical protein
MNMRILSVYHESESRDMGRTNPRSENCGSDALDQMNAFLTAITQCGWSLSGKRLDSV